MALRLTTERSLRPPFVAALFAAVLLGGLVAGERFANLELPLPSGGLLASVLPGSVVSLTNEERADNHLSGLRANALLTKAAQMKADDMAAKSYYAHVSPDGTIPPYWVNKVGYKYQMMGENLVIDRESSEDVVSAWMGSHDHRENILNPSFTEIGVGVAYGTYKGRDTIYVVQMLARPQAVAETSKPAPKPAAPKPAPKPVPLPTIPEPAKPVAAPPKTVEPVLVRPSVPKPVVKDPIAPILEAIASTTLESVPNIVASSTYLPPVLGTDASLPVELSASAPAPAPIRMPLRQKIGSFVNGVTGQLKSFLRVY